MNWIRPLEAYAPDPTKVPSLYCSVSEDWQFSICRVMMNSQACYELWRLGVIKEMLAILGPFSMEDIDGRRVAIDTLKNTAESIS